MVKHTNRKRRKTLFERQRLCNPKCESTACALCGKIYRKDVLSIKNNPPLSIEHAPQQSHSVKAVERCLTCRQPCNNERKAEASAGFERKERQASCHLRTMGVRSSVHFSGGTATRKLEKASLTRTEELLIKLFNHESPSKSDLLVELASAYFIAFATLGYTYAFDPSLDIVRLAILQNRSENVCAISKGIPDGELRVGTLNGLPCVMVSLQPAHPTNKGTDGHVVILPRPGSSEDFYQRLNNMSTLLRGVANSRWDQIGEPISYNNQTLPKLWDSTRSHAGKCEVQSSNELASPYRFGSFRMVCENHGLSCDTNLTGDYLLPISDSGEIAGGYERIQKILGTKNIEKLIKVRQT